eukprot:525818-Rhodomonas_salina.2
MHVHSAMPDADVRFPDSRLELTMRIPGDVKPKMPIGIRFVLWVPTFPVCCAISGSDWVYALLGTVVGYVVSGRKWR